MGDSSIGDIESQASAGDLAAQLQMARALLEKGQTDRGRDWLRRAAGAGSTEAKLALSERLLSQEPYDIFDGYKWARAAAEDGDGRAEHLLAVVTAEGLGAPQDWQVALDHLQRSAELGYAPARAELAALAGDWNNSSGSSDWGALRRAVDVSAWLKSPPVHSLSSSPRIGVVRNFISPELSRWMIERARTGLIRAQTINPHTGRGQYDSEVRNNSSAPFEVAAMDMILVMVRARISQLVQLPIRGFEDSQVLHYAPGEEFKPHYDFLQVAKPGHALAVASGGQRVVTFLIYLNEDYEGGETAFLSLGRRYKGKTGDGLFFYNAMPDGTLDRRTLHAGVPTTRGEKYLFSQWIRLRVG